MALSKRANAERMKAYRAGRKVGGTVLLSKALVKKLHRLGISPARYMTASPVTLNDYGDMKRRYEAKCARVDWQSGGIRMLQGELRMLQGELARARALLAMQPAMQDGAVLQRIAQVEAELALSQATQETTLLPDEEPGGEARQAVALLVETLSSQAEGPPLEKPPLPPFKDLRRFLELHAAMRRKEAVVRP